MYERYELIKSYSKIHLNKINKKILNKIKNSTNSNNIIYLNQITINRLNKNKLVINI